MRTEFFLTFVWKGNFFTLSKIIDLKTLIAYQRGNWVDFLIATMKIRLKVENVINVVYAETLKMKDKDLPQVRVYLKHDRRELETELGEVCPLEFYHSIFDIAVENGWSVVDATYHP